MPVTAAYRRATIFDAFDKALGAPPDMPASAATVIKADYKVPFLPHATMEPMACTARVDGDRAEVWAGTQDPLNARKTAAEALGFGPEQVQYTNLALGGGFGRKLPVYLDFVGMSARIAKAMSPAPVKMIWSRENDMQHGYYRPAGMARFAGALDATGAPLAVRSFYAGGGDGESVFMPYTIADKKFSARDAKHPIRTGPVALGAQLAARLLQGIVHRRDGARGEEGSVPVPPRPDDRSAALQGGARARGGDGRLGQAAARARRAAASPSPSASAPSSPRSRTCRCRRTACSR